MDFKYCEDCDHYKKHNFGQPETCLSPNAKKKPRNLVTRGDGPTCLEERALGGNCGYKGKNWERKE